MMRDEVAGDSPVRLFIPGPVDVPADALAAQTTPLIGHRSQEMDALFADMQGKLRHVFRTASRVYVFASSGTGMHEACIRNGVRERGRVLMLIEGVGPRMSHKLIEQFLGEEDPWQSLLRMETRGRARPGLKTLGQVLCECSERTRPADLAQYLMQYYLPILKRTHADDYARRLRDLEHFQGLTERYQTLERLLSDMALDPPSASLDEALPVDPDEGPLVLSTVHSAKGLEWHSVFIIWALEGRFPSYYNTHSLEELEEERRLLYVAATRAKENLFFAYPSGVYDRSLGMVLSRPSSFIDGIPEDLLEPMSLVHEDSYYSQR